MKKITFSLKILIPILILTGVVMAFAGVPHWMYRSRPIPVVAPAADKGVVYKREDENMLRELMGVYARIDSCHELFMTGSLDARDPADSSSTLHSPFRFCRKGNELYYQTGDVEMVALEDIYITVSKSTKKMFVGPARTIISPFKMATDSMVDIWRNDHYTIDTKVVPEQTTVRLLCPNHITCKEYRYDYDPGARVLRGVYMRLTNLNDPLNTAMDKEVKMSVDLWKEKDIPMALLRTGTYLVKGTSGWKPAAAYADYTLISLF